MRKTANINIDLKQKLGVPEKEIIKHLKASIGSKIKKDELIAEARRLFKKIQVKAPLDGKIKSLQEDGILIITVDEDKEAKVKDIISSTKTIEADLVFFDDQKKLIDLHSDSKGKVLFCQFSLREEFIYKAEALGVAAILFEGDKKDHDLARWQDLTIGVFFYKKDKYDNKFLAKLNGKKVKIVKGEIK